MLSSARRLGLVLPLLLTAACGGGDDPASGGDAGAPKRPGAATPTRPAPTPPPAQRPRVPTVKLLLALTTQPRPRGLTVTRPSHDRPVLALRECQPTLYTVRGGERYSLEGKQLQAGLAPPYVRQDRLRVRHALGGPPTRPLDRRPPRPSRIDGSAELSRALHGGLGTRLSARAILELPGTRIPLFQYATSISALGQLVALNGEVYPTPGRNRAVDRARARWMHTLSSPSGMRQGQGKLALFEVDNEPACATYGPLVGLKVGRSPGDDSLWTARGYRARHVVVARKAGELIAAGDRSLRALAAATGVDATPSFDEAFPEPIDRLLISPDERWLAVAGARWVWLLDRAARTVVLRATVADPWLLGFCPRGDHFIAVEHLTPTSWLVWRPGGDARVVPGMLGPEHGACVALRGKTARDFRLFVPGGRTARVDHWQIGERGLRLASRWRGRFLGLSAAHLLLATSPPATSGPPLVSEVALHALDEGRTAPPFKVPELLGQARLLERRILLPTHRASAGPHNSWQLLDHEGEAQRLIGFPDGSIAPGQWGGHLDADRQARVALVRARRVVDGAPQRDSVTHLLDIASMPAKVIRTYHSASRLSPSGRYVVAMRAKGRPAAIEQVEDGKPVASLMQIGGLATSLAAAAFSPDERFVAVVRPTGTIELIDLKLKLLVANLPGHARAMVLFLSATELAVITNGKVEVHQIAGA